MEAELDERTGWRGRTCTHKWLVQRRATRPRALHGFVGPGQRSHSQDREMVRRTSTVAAAASRPRGSPFRPRGSVPLRQHRAIFRIAPAPAGARSLRALSAQTPLDPYPRFSERLGATRWVWTCRVRSLGFRLKVKVFTHQGAGEAEQRIRRELVISLVNQVTSLESKFEHSGGPETRDPSPQKSHAMSTSAQTSVTRAFKRTARDSSIVCTNFILLQ